MSIRRFRWLLVLALVALFAVGVGSASADPGSHPAFQQQQQSINELSQLSGQEFEIGYINRIIPHHQGALQMVQIMQSKVVNQPLQDELNQMISSQTEEINLLTSYLQQTYGQSVQPDARFQMSPSMMQQLQNATPQMAEQMFMLMMREHHQSANQLGKLVLSKNVSATLTNQAQKMVDDQTAQQGRFAAYLQNWYGVSAPEPTGDVQAGMEYAMGTLNLPGMPNTGEGGTARSVDNGLATTTTLGIVALLAVVSVGGLAVLRRARNQA